MNGNLARSSLCSFVTSVDFGLYSSMVGTRCDCWVCAIRGQSSALLAPTIVTKAKIVNQDFIGQLPSVSREQIVSHKAADQASWRDQALPVWYRNVHTVFEGEAAMAAENARIEAEARELVKKRPYGPWLFR